MRDLLRFIVKYSARMLWALYMILSCLLLFSSNPFQHHVFLTSAGVLSSGIYRATSSVTNYFDLRDINEDLQRRNSYLELELTRMREVVRHYKEKQFASDHPVDTVLARYDFTIANVINNSVTHSHNYATLQRGRLDGVEPEMGVIDQNGVVGIVNLVTDHTARVITVLNPDLRLSCKIKGRQQVGSLTWDGKNPSEALLEELPRHALFHKGDTVVTSGYSTAFPEGVAVGTVIGRLKGHDDNFMTLLVKLSTDFSTLSTVRVVRDNLKPEIEAVEKKEGE